MFAKRSGRRSARLLKPLLAKRLCSFSGSLPSNLSFGEWDSPLPATRTHCRDAGPDAAPCLRRPNRWLQLLAEGQEEADVLMPGNEPPACAVSRHQIHSMNRRQGVNFMPNPDSKEVNIPLPLIPGRPPGDPSDQYRAQERFVAPLTIGHSVWGLDHSNIRLLLFAIRRLPHSCQSLFYRFARRLLLLALRLFRTSR